MLPAPRCFRASVTATYADDVGVRDQPGARAMEAGAPRVLPPDGDQLASGPTGRGGCSCRARRRTERTGRPGGAGSPRLTRSGPGTGCPAGAGDSGGRACFSASASHLGRHRGEGHDLLLPDRSTPRVAELPSAFALTVCKTAVSTDRTTRTVFSALTTPAHHSDEID